MCVKCSIYGTKIGRSGCIQKLGEDWKGLCAYQQKGCTIEEWHKKITPACANGCPDGGCIMLGYRHAQWNGLCAYQD